MKILIAIDDSKFSGDVSRAIVAQFRTENTEVRVLMCCSRLRRPRRRWHRATPLSWKNRKSQPVSW